MVQEYVSPVRVHKYSFEMVMAAYERRFPSCSQIPVVVECVITEDSWSADDSQRHTTRRCQLNVDAPYLLKKMIGVDFIYFIQKNHLDLKARVLEIEATNETFSSRVGVVEKCKYYVHPENSEWTCFEQSALLDVKNFFGLENTVEKIAMKQYASNIAKGKELIESFMMEVHADGVTELKAWSEYDSKSNRELRRIVSRGTEPLSPTPVAETRKHSQPGPSKSRTNIVTPKSSCKQIKPSKSNLKQPSHEISQKSICPSCSNLKIGSADQKKTNLTRKSSKLLMGNPKTADGPKEQLSRMIAESLEDVQLTQWKKEDIIRKKALSHSDLSSNHKPELIERETVLSKPCVCDQRTQVNVTDLFTRWDNLLVVLVCSLLIVLLLSTPLSFFLGRRYTR